ncbi:DUF2804 domain-containing protein [bacterium]|nr:DUF2804 domain-containing protein [candidate division CSSED10-310 bacterium]
MEQSTSPLLDGNGDRLPQLTAGIHPELDLWAQRRRLGARGWPPYRLKRWIFTGVLSPRCIAGVAFVHLGYLTNCFAYVWRPGDNQPTETSMLRPPFPWQQFEPFPLRGVAEFTTLPVRFTYSSKGMHFFSRFPARKLDIILDFDLEAHFSSALQAVNPVNPGYWAYTGKLAGFPVTGCIHDGNQEIVLKAGESAGIVDWTFGCHARTTEWLWATGCGRSGAINTAFNFSRKVYDRGAGENCVWIGGRPILLPSVSIDRGPRDGCWRVSGAGGKVDLHFEPSGARSEHTDLGLVASRFTQWFGHYSGELLDTQGHRFPIDQALGFFEEHHARW